jgi:leucyl-tRNA synthetase
MTYQPNQIDETAKKIWNDQDVYRVENDFSKPKKYILDMFPYPSGAGLHVGHPLGYVASDIYSRFLRMQGYNVLHPMGFDSFGLPAEQYAIETGQHPRDTTAENIKTYRRQFDKIGLSYDWSRQVVTSDPSYYKWTQWIFSELFNSIYCYENQRAYKIDILIKHFEDQGSKGNTAYTNQNVDDFTDVEWKLKSEKEKSDILMNYRLAYVSYGEVNWCEALSTVLANDEVINGRSERGNHPVIKKKMRQWSLRITAYAERLLRNLDGLQFAESLKDQQRNWIGKSVGATIKFKVDNHPAESVIAVYTTRPDTIFGATFMVLAPEHPMVSELTSSENHEQIEAYISTCKSKSEIDRQAEKTVSGQFTGSYAVHPFTKKRIPIYIAEYVLMGYGSGAIMAVPAEDERDRKFAEKYDIEIVEIFDKSGILKTEIGDKQGKLMNSDFINGMSWETGFEAVVLALEKQGIANFKTQYRLRDANFSRQRYWGEPFPVLWKDDMPQLISVGDLPVENADVSEITPTADGRAPQARNEEWVNSVPGFQREVDTMPAFAGSSWYFLRYMDPNNTENFVDKKVATYWNQVDVYVGGTEHAVGHLLYSRFFNMVLFDLGHLSFEEPYKRLINQGMIQGRTQFVYRSNLNPNLFVSKNLIPEEQMTKYSPIRVDVSFVESDILDLEKFKAWRKEYAMAEFKLEDGKYVCGSEIEKMSKSKYNVVNPDTIIDKYGADTFRMYEMFLGPIEQGKPWNPLGIEGVSKFLKRFYSLYFDEVGQSRLTDLTPTSDELKSLHKLIDKVTRDMENFSFNTSVSSLMIALNELTSLKTTSSEILIPLLKVICPLAPHTAEAIWVKLGNKESIVKLKYPEANLEYLKEDSIEYPVSINGKTRTKIRISADADENLVKEIVLADEVVLKWIDAQEVRKFIFVKNRMINIVVS